MELKQSPHHHPLNLRQDNDSKGVCFLCLKSIIRNSFYVCEDCNFYLHKWCVELPSVIHHQFHPQHSLNLSRKSSFNCHSCHKKFEEKPCFTCHACDFDLDVGCALMHEVKPEGEDFIQHFSHQHPMSFCSQDPPKLLTCFTCKKITSEVVYGCITCEYFLHKSCFELPTTLLHALHPQHPLHLRIKYGLCHACRLKDYTFKFCCARCDFSLDVSCWMEYTWKKEGQNLERGCFICSKQHSDSISCVHFKYFRDQKCIWLTKEINHPFHSHNTLQLIAPKDFWCDSCHRWFNRMSCYHCHDCNFHMDVKCALVAMIQHNAQEKYLRQSLPSYFSHQHPLCLITQDFEIICSICQTTRPSPIYGCLQCGYFLHQSCIELPSEIESPLHSQHKLTIELFHNEYCQLCLKKYNGFFFGCLKCQFYIGIECYSLFPKFNVRYAYHEHPLCLVENSYCDKCDSYDPFCEISKFSSEIQLTRTYLLRCVQCNYNVHLLCGPLLLTIKDKNHLHRLTLTDSVVDENDDDGDEFYCDVCEEERDPKVCVYYCNVCAFVSHVHCLMPQILSALKKDPLQVELRIARDLKLEEREYRPCYNASGKVSNLKDVLDSLSEEERKHIECHFPETKLFGEDKDYSSTEDGGGITSKYQGSDIIQELSMHLELEAMFSNKSELFQLGRKYHIQPYEYELKIVEVEVKDKEYVMITSNFASLLSTLFKRHGGFNHSHSSVPSFQKQLKAIIFYLVCRMVNDMRRTYLADAKERQLLTWYYYCYGIEKLGFDLSFLKPFMIGTTLRFYYLRTMKLEEELPDQVALEIVDLEGKILEIKKQIQRRKSYLLQFKPKNDLHRYFLRKQRWLTIGKDII